MPAHSAPKQKKKQTDLKETIAEIITRIFSPITATIVGLVVIYVTYIDGSGQSGIPWLLAALGFFIVAIGTLAIFRKIGLISNWDITDRKQRPRFLALISFYCVVLLLITYALGYYDAMPILILLVLSLIISSAITLVWKISFHTFAVTLCVLLVIVISNEPYTLFLLFVPIVTAWTRVYLQKHTTAQAIGGILLGIFMLWIWNVFP